MFGIILVRQRYKNICRYANVIVFLYDFQPDVVVGEKK